MAIRLLWPVPVGMADNNDGARLMCQLGADSANSHVPAVKAWLLQYTMFRYPAIQPGTRCSAYTTSQVLPLQVLSWIHKDVLGLSGVIDMREAIVLNCLLVGTVTAVGVRVLLPRRPLAALAYVVGLFVVLADATFADYQASPFTETAALNGLLVFAVAGVLLVAHTKRRTVVFLVAWLAALFAVTAKTETVTLAIVFSGFFLTVRIETPRFGARLERRRKSARHRDRVLPVICAVTLITAAAYVMTSGFTSSQAPSELVNVANEITMTVMPNSDDPGAVAQGLGLPPTFGEYSGLSVWSKHPIESDPGFPAVADRFTTQVLGAYLARHPVLSARVLASGSTGYLEFRNDYLGTYPAGTGHPAGSQECRECLVTDVSHAFEPVGFTGIVAYWVACALAAIALIRRSTPKSLSRGFGAVSLTLIGCAVAQYATSVFGEGNEVTKHLAASLFAATLAPLWVLVGFLAVRRRRGATPSSSPGTASSATVPDQPTSRTRAEPDAPLASGSEPLTARVR